MSLKERLQVLDEPELLLDDHDSACIGVGYRCGQPSVRIYSRSKIVDDLVASGMEVVPKSSTACEPRIHATEMDEAIIEDLVYATKQAEHDRVFGYEREPSADEIRQKQDLAKRAKVIRRARKLQTARTKNRRKIERSRR